MRLLRYIAPVLLSAFLSGEATNAQDFTLGERIIETTAENGAAAKLRLSGYNAGLPIAIQNRYSVELTGKGIERAVFVVGVDRFEGSIPQRRNAVDMSELTSTGKRGRTYSWIKPDQILALHESITTDLPSWITDRGYDKTVCIVEGPLEAGSKGLSFEVPVDLYKDGRFRVYASTTIRGRKINFSDGLPFDLRETLPQRANSSKIEQTPQSFGWIQQSPYMPFVLLSGSSLDVFYQATGDRDVLSSDPFNILSVSGTTILGEKAGNLWTVDFHIDGRPATLSWKQITNGQSFSQAFLSPFADRIAYVKGGHLYSKPIGGQEILVSDLHVDSDENWIPWSGDSFVLPAKGDLWEVSNDGTTRKLIDTPEKESGIQSSPRNRNISFISGDQIHIKDAAGSRQLTQGQGDIRYSWSTRDDFLVYSRGGRIFVVRTETGDTRDITPQDPSDYLENPTFSPDERSVLCRGRKGIYTIGLSY